MSHSLNLISNSMQFVYLNFLVANIHCIYFYHRNLTHFDFNKQKKTYKSYKTS